MDEWATMCKPHPQAGRIRGCNFHVLGYCNIYVAPVEYLEKSRDTVENIVKHEIGHCNGWPWNHPR